MLQRESRTEGTAVWTMMDMVRLLERTKMSQSVFTERLERRFNMIREDYEDLGDESDKPAMDYITLCVKSIQYLMTVVNFEELTDIRRMMAQGIYYTISKITAIDLIEFRGLNLKIVSTISDLVGRGCFMDSMFQVGADGVVARMHVAEEGQDESEATGYLRDLLTKVTVIEDVKLGDVDYNNSSLESDIFNTIKCVFDAYCAGHYTYDGQLNQMRRIVTMGEVMLTDIIYDINESEDARVFCNACVGFTNHMHENQNASKEALDALENVHDIALKIAHRTYLV